MAQPTGVLLLLLVSAVSLASGRVLRDTVVGAKNFTCGLRPVQPSLIGQKIVNGQTPKYGSIPWQASLYGTFNGKVKFMCGGIIIDDDWVLTAAHCFDNIDLSKVEVHVGDHDRFQKDLSEQSFMLKNGYIHEGYNNPPFDNDIALLELQPSNDKVIQFDDNVQPACLPTPDTPYTEGKMGLISGWGRKNPQGNGSTLLQVAEVPLLSHSQCVAALKPSLMDRHLTSNHVCAGPVRPYGGQCSGDSGGPLVTKEAAGYTVLGIIAWVVPGSCGTKGDPGMCTKVSQYIPWIQEKMKV